MSDQQKTPRKRSQRKVRVPFPIVFIRLIMIYSLYVVSKIFWDIKIVGDENIPDDKAFIICPNHESFLDPYWVCCCLSNKLQHRIVAPADHQYFSMPVLKYVLQVSGGIKVNHKKGKPTRGYERLKRALDNNLIVLMFPEGQRSFNGKLTPFKKGAAQLAIDTNNPILPVHIDGAFEMYHRPRALPKFFNWKKRERYKLRIKIGKPIYPTDHKVDYQAANHLTKVLRDEIISMGAKA